MCDSHRLQHWFAWFLLIHIYITKGGTVCKKYHVADSNRFGSCNECRVCNLTSSDIRSSCKKLYPNPIDNQGYAWCKHERYSLPQCPSWMVSNGVLQCDKNFSVFSVCNVVCNKGYTVVQEKPVECTEELYWNATESARPLCTRASPPDQPELTSSAIRSQARVNSDVTLTCRNKSALAGAPSYFWFFNHQALYWSTNSTLYLMTIKKSSEGLYSCLIQDMIGNSSLSPGYKLEVESYHEDNGREDYKLIFVYITVGSILVVLFLILVKWKFPKILLQCMTCIKKKVTKPAVKEQRQRSDKMDSEVDRPLTSGESDDPSNIQNLQIVISPVTKPEVKEQRQCSDKMDSEVDRPLTSGESDDPSNIQNLQIVISPDPSKVNISNLNETSNNNQKALKILFNKQSIMRQVELHLDQIPDPDRNKPTFIDLAKFLGWEINQIEHLKFTCSFHKTSPSMSLLQTMIHEGQGLDSFLKFLSDHNCSDLIRFIEKEMK